ncbi:uncharacterized protein LOC131677667 [Topomyia yanbarensis]|uniref:uncharacterized protein LOC131677667 n=1 Tax=Topomyia yanbarensis TaxID=2498891 RepID=UPI00273B6952|nr:uncharacterized protein LOC131677667 [Topomyia yanbarensis]
MDIEVHKAVIDSHISRLNSILTNLRKAPNRAYKRNTLTTKLTDARTTYTLITNILADYESEYPENEFNFLYKCTRQIYSEIHTLITTKLEYAGVHTISVYSLACAVNFIQKLKYKIRAKMAKVDIRLGTTLVQMYDGAPENLDAFIDAVNLFNDTVVNDFAAATAAQQAAAQVTVVRFVKSRLTGVARQVIVGANDLQGIFDAVKQHCESKITSDNIIAKLKAVKQKESAESFCSAVEKLTAQLRSVYVTEQIPINRANTMATKKGVEALIDGVRNNDTKIVLKAGTFTKITDATEKLMENDKPTPTQMFTIRSTQQNNHGRNFNNGRGNCRGHFQYYRGNQNNFQRSNSNRGNYNGYRGNFHGRGNHNGRRPYHQRGQLSQRGHFNPHYGMYVAQNIPQQLNQTPVFQPMQNNMQPSLPTHPPTQQIPQPNFLGQTQGQFMP